MSAPAPVSSFGRLHRRLVDVFYDARRELNAREYDELLAVAAVLVAQRTLERLEHQERPQ